MKKILNFKIQNVAIVLFGLFSFLGSMHQGSYIYDGFHWGLVASNASDFLNGKKPYDDFFVHYGFLTVLIQSFSLKIYNSVFSIFILSAFFYSFSIILFSKLLEKFLPTVYVYVFLFILAFMQPFIVYPWHNYFIFFTSIVSILCFIKRKYFFLFFFGFFLQLGFLFSESYKIFSIFIILISMFVIIKENHKILDKFKKILVIILGYALPLSIFLIYLYLNNLFDA